MADSEIIVDIFNYCVKINANLLKERDIEINPTVDTSNRMDTDVVMQENAPESLGSTREYIPCGSYSFSGVNSNDHSET